MSIAITVAQAIPNCPNPVNSVRAYASGIPTTHSDPRVISIGNRVSPAIWNEFCNTWPHPMAKNPKTKMRTQVWARFRNSGSLLKIERKMTGKAKSRALRTPFTNIT